MKSIKMKTVEDIVLGYLAKERYRLAERFSRLHRSCQEAGVDVICRYAQ
jgi:hypothetical protein